MKKSTTYRVLVQDGQPLEVLYDVPENQPTQDGYRRRTRTDVMNYAAYVASLHTNQEQDE